MSRGYGRIQSTVLSALYHRERSRQHHAWLDTAELTIRVFGEPFTHTQIVSVQRALRALEDQGKVERGGRIFSRHEHWRLCRR